MQHQLFLDATRHNLAACIRFFERRTVSAVTHKTQDVEGGLAPCMVVAQQQAQVEAVPSIGMHSIWELVVPVVQQQAQEEEVPSIGMHSMLWGLVVPVVHALVPHSETVALAKRKCAGSSRPFALLRGYVHVDRSSCSCTWQSA